ncbi:MAG: CYTH domain-containing protein [Halomonas sp.]|uniref:CYTH domain-containing protein n=1 Tax=Halomonas sp. TaxID=1486246 RepID=UPI0019EE0CE6|nr:CYTH domain-containing protein [Halomonas sp.]MBE0487890.1 CYTH domain-containing protein [Halomonas sp.]
MSCEIELKLSLGPEGPTALRRHPLLTSLPMQASHLGNTYFDTPQGDLEAARMALRLRRVDGRLLQTLKTRGEGGGGLSKRGEWEWEVPGPGLDLEGLADLPTATLGQQALERLAPRFTTDFHRETRMLDHREARIEVALDEGEILADGRRVAIREMELELKAGEPEALWSLAEALAGSVALRPADTSKAARGGALLGAWRLPEGGTPSAWLHRAVVALDALADSGDDTWRHAAADALGRLAEASGDDTGDTARELAEALYNPAWLTPAFGLTMVRLARRLPADRPLG